MCGHCGAFIEFDAATQTWLSALGAGWCAGANIRHKPKAITLDEALALIS